ncbi:MAG: hypothetical protein CVT67_08905 [Actinobacteria bacterium HGW-Actinobacteria-7]|jgi:CelD/BcsL family acetyltransferase involved in cellulose biosynthesis|nr:MAG: hypothetical protein CVT67_08905 [Actinobacteria bacterium HGW-Actinobacteria-7]
MIKPWEQVFLDPAGEPWVEFVSARSTANIFHHSAWTNLIAECYDYRPFVVAVQDGDGAVRAGIPMMETGSRLRGRHWTSLPFTDHCAPLHDSAVSSGRLTDSLVVLSDDSNTPPMGLRCNLPPRAAIQTYSHHVLHTVQLAQDSDGVFRRFQPMHRRNVRTSEKKGVRIEWGRGHEDLDAFYRLHLETRRRQGVPIQPRRFFDLLGSNLIDKGLGFVLLAYKDEQCLAAAVFLHWQRTLTYKFGASAADGLSLRPNNLLFWTAIRWGCENGYDVFDMGRTDLANTGLRAFKSGWGADEVPLTYSHLPPRTEGSAVGHLMPAVNAVISHSPLWVCRATGELLYKYVE